jgi:H+-translocating NAD(P) transhydrogenase subunit alpha
MILGLLKEPAHDPRVALTPANLTKLVQNDLQFWVEKSAGEAAFFADSEFEKCAKIASRGEILANADLLVHISPLAENELSQVKKGATVVAQFAPFANPEIVQQLDNQQVTAFSLDMIPRTTIAQTMDILSSMAGIAGYEAVLLAASNMGRYVPMMVTAAGTIRPAKALVLGAGVAGLQAIATLRRLGAVVEVFDTRAAAKEEVQSLGAKFVEVAGASDDKGAGGYAVQQSDEYLARQRAEVQARAEKSDIIICTAQVRGCRAPVLITAETVSKMRPGSVIVDLAASTGGNCEGTKDNETVAKNGVKIIGNSNLAARMPMDASVLFGNNVANFLKILFKKDGTFAPDFSNEIIGGSKITKG